jgi:hypothetical protein
VNPPPQTVYTVFSRRRLQITPEINKSTSSAKSSEYVNQESAVSWNLIPLLDTKQQKDVKEKGYHNSTHLSKECDSFSQNESKKDVSKLENGSYLPNRRDVYHSETKSEREHVKINKSNTDSSKQTSHTLPKEPIPRHCYQRDEYSSYSKYKAERYERSDSDRSRTHSTHVSSEYHSHSERWESYKIPRTIHETNVSHARSSLRSRSRSVSQSRTEPESVQNTKGRYDVRASSHSRSSVLSETSDKHMNRALKLADSDPSTYHLKSQLTTETQFEISKDLSCKPQKKFTHSGEPHSETHASTVELGSSLKIPQTEPGIKVQISPYTKSNLSEHSSFKRSRRPKIVKLNSETKPSEASNSVNDSDLVTNTRSNFFCEHNQTEGIKRHLDSKERDEAHLRDSKRQALDDITGRECYNYKEYDKNTDPKQKYNGRVKRQLSPGSVNEKLLKTNKCTKDESSNIKNTDIAALEERNTAKELKEETGPQNIKLDVEEGEICEDDDTQPTTENTVEKKETICNNTNTKSDSRKSNERNRKKEKHKAAHNTDTAHVRLTKHSVESEGREKNKYSEDGNKKLRSSKNCKQTTGKKEEFEVEVAQIEADSSKHSKATRKEEEISKNTQKISLLETNKGDGIQNCSEGQTESVKRTKDGRLNKKQKEKEMQHGKLKEPVTEVSVSHEVIKTGTVQVSYKSVLRGNSVKLSTESNKVSPVINLKFRARRSIEHKLEDSKVVLSVNITPPKDRVRTESSSDSLIVESVGMSAEKINSISKTQK